MAYALLIIEPPGQRETRSEAEGREHYERMLRFSEDLKDKELLTVSQSLVSDRRGARVRIQARSDERRGWSFLRSQGNDRRILTIDMRVTGAGHRDRPAMPGRSLGDGRGPRARPVLHLTGRGLP